MGLMDAVTGGLTVGIVITAVDKYSKEFTKAGTSMTKFKTLAVGGGIAAGVALLAIGKASVTLAGNLEQATIAFTTMLGSGEKADKLLQELSDFAAKTPFTIPGIRANAKQLLAMGIEADNLLPTMKSLGDVSAGLSVPMERLALNFGQVKVQGKLTGRELRDFSIAGVPLIAELSKNLNVAEADIASMVSKGDIGFAEVEEAFRTMTMEGGKFANLMDKQSESFQGMVSNIQDTFIQVGEGIGAQLLPQMKELAQVVLDNKEGIEAFGGDVGTVMGAAATFIVRGVAGLGQLSQDLDKQAQIMANNYIQEEKIILLMNKHNKTREEAIQLIEEGKRKEGDMLEYTEEAMARKVELAEAMLEEGMSLEELKDRYWKYYDALAMSILATTDITYGTEEFNVAMKTLVADLRGKVAPALNKDTILMRMLTEEANKSTGAISSLNAAFAVYAAGARAKGTDALGYRAPATQEETDELMLEYIRKGLIDSYTHTPPPADESAQSGYDGTLSKDTTFKAHAGENVSISPAAGGGGNNVTINVNGTGDPATVAREIYKKFAALGG